MRAVEGLFAGPLISLHGSACTEKPAILIAVIIWRHYIGESGGKISSRSCDYLCSGWEPSRPYGPVDSGSFIWDSHWPLATGIITGWAGSYTEARLEQQLKSSLSHRPVPALRIWVDALSVAMATGKRLFVWRQCLSRQRRTCEAQAASPDAAATERQLHTCQGGCIVMFWWDKYQMWLTVGGIKWRVDVAETIWVNTGKKPHCSKAAWVKHDFGGRCWLPTPA